MARAAVVLMTPDDEARLKREFWQDSELATEKEYAGQPRQNVLFEAGFALGKYADRTVIVELGQLRAMSDRAGRHVIRIDDTVDKRQDLAERLKAAGCDVKMDGMDWHDEGDFEAAIAVEVSAEPTSSHVENGVRNTSAPKSDEQDEGRKLPTPADFVKVGEFLWYLSNPPLATADNFVSAIRGFLSKLDECQLQHTRRAASALSKLSLFYDRRTDLVTKQTLDNLAAIMIAVRSTLEDEANEATWN